MNVLRVHEESALKTLSKNKIFFVNAIDFSYRCDDSKVRKMAASCCWMVAKKYVSFFYRLSTSLNLQGSDELKMSYRYNVSLHRNNYDKYVRRDKSM